MQPGVPNKPMPPQYQPPYAGGGSGGRGCGCFAFGCGGILIGLIGLCGIGYYSLLFSPLPLQFVKQALEESGDVKIDGLKGNLSRGFEMTTLKFRDKSQRNPETGDPQWSELTDLRIKYRNGGIFSGSFTIEEIGIGGGTIYGDLDFNTELSGDLMFNELQEEFSDIQGELSGSSRGSIAIDRISIRDLKISDLKTDEQFQISEISLNDVLVKDGRLVEFGDLNVKADGLELETIRSNEIKGSELERTFKGRLKKELLADLRADLPFEIEFGVLKNGKVATKARWFEGQVISESGFPEQSDCYLITGFSPANHVRFRELGILPEEINLGLTYDEKKRQRIATVDSAGYLQLGQSRIDRFRLPEETEPAPDRRLILASTEVAGREIQVELYLLKQLPLIGVKLLKAEDWTLEETWAQTVFGRSYAELDEADCELLQQNIARADRRFRSKDADSKEESKSRRKSSDGESKGQVEEHGEASGRGEEALPDSGARPSADDESGFSREESSRENKPDEGDGAGSSEAARLHLVFAVSVFAC